MTLGGWAITQQCFDWILDNVPSGSKVLEFGSGMGTGELVKHFDMTSIEQDSFWMNGFSGSRYIHAPIVDDWYSWEALENGDLENDYVLIIVDGPSKRMRKGMQDFYLAHPVKSNLQSLERKTLLTEALSDRLLKIPRLPLAGWG